MTYLSHAEIAMNFDIRARLIACASDENAPDPSNWVARNIWSLVGSDWVAAWESARASVHPRPNDPSQPDEIGRDEAVISDQALLSAVQRALNEGV